MTEQVVIKIGADATRALLAFQNVGRAALAMRASLIGAGVMVAAKAIQIATSIPRGIMAAIDRADKAFAASQIAGLSVEEFSALSYAAGQAEVSLSDLEMASRYLAKTHNAALIPTLIQTAEEFEGIDDEVEKIRITTERFGKSGSGLIPFLNQGGAAIRSVLGEAKQIGVVIDKDFAKAADAFNDSWDRMTKSFDGFYTAAAIKVLPALQWIVDGVNGIVLALRDLFKGTGPLSEFFDLLMDTAKYLMATVEALFRLFDDIPGQDIWRLLKGGEGLKMLDERFRHASEPMTKVLQERLDRELKRTDPALESDLETKKGRTPPPVKADKVTIEIPESKASSAFTSRGFLSQGEAQMVSRTASFQKNVQSTLAEILGLQRQYLPKMAESLS